MLTEIPLMDLEIPEEERYVEEEKRFTYEINVEEGERVQHICCYRIICLIDYLHL